MPQKSLRAAAATSTLLLGLAAVWLVGAASSLEARLAQILVPESELTLPDAPPASPEYSEAQEVYSEVVREMFGGWNGRAQVVVAPETVNEYVCGPPARIDGADGEAMRDYDRQRNETKRIPALPRVAATQVFLDLREFVETFYDSDSVDWAYFYERYPHSSGYITLSAVGFNGAGDEAFLFATRTCGYLCEDGWHLLLRKRADGWRIVRKESV